MSLSRRPVIAPGLLALLTCLGCGRETSPPQAASSQAAPSGAAPAQAAPRGELLTVGAAAPDVVGTGADGKSVRLSDVAGRPAVVYFYPKDDTPGCTKEACAFRDAFDRFQRAGVVIFGVSRDSEQSHSAFRQKHNLPFPLVADEGGAVQQAYGVPSRAPGLAARVSFLVDRKGNIARVWPDVDPAVHANEVLEAAERLGS